MHTKLISLTRRALFFFMRACSEFNILSNNLHLQQKNDLWSLNQASFPSGTRIQFLVNRNSPVDMKPLFEKFAPADEHTFNSTFIPLSIATVSGDLVSRSQAKRILHRAHAFAVFELDFSNIKHIGQGFADELCRVIPSNHPSTSFFLSKFSADIEPIINRIVHPSNVFFKEF